MSMKSKGACVEVSGRNVLHRKWALLLCVASFCAGMFFTNRIWSMAEYKEISRASTEIERIKLNSEGCNLNLGSIQLLVAGSTEILFMQLGCHKFYIWCILDKAIEVEERLHADFLRLNHIEGYLELSAKTKIYFSIAVALWDAEFYVKVDDVHVNLATLGLALTMHRRKPRVYIGCMKSGPVLAQKGVKYHEPEYWKFGEVGNKYFRHATGQLYAISQDLAAYISINQDVLHKYANEDVSLGSWFIGLDVDHVDDRKMCCGTPPEWKAQAGNICVASFDWKCSGICRSVERMKEVHQRCGEDENALWSATL
ncbi:putative beta-1,3-galactosyltransferase 2 [Glycine max]|nr:putative beta-1,3-galactosyltransferase 2 [Glycine max]